MQQEEREMAASILGTKQPRALKRRGLADRCNVANVGRILIAESRSFGRACKGKAKTCCNLRCRKDQDGARLKPFIHVSLHLSALAASPIASAARGDLPARRAHHGRSGFHSPTITTSMRPARPLSA